MKLKNIFTLIFVIFFGQWSMAESALLSCLKIAGYDEGKVAADLGDPTCSSQYTNPLFDALSGGIIVLSVGGSKSFADANTCMQLPYNAAGNVIAQLIINVVPGLSADVKTKLSEIAEGNSVQKISDVLPTDVLNVFLKPWTCACRFASIKADFIATASDVNNCVSIFGDAAQDVGEWVQGLGGPIYHTSGCVMCADPPIYACKEDPYPVALGKCGCVAPRVAKNGYCACPGNQMYESWNGNTPGYCAACASGHISDKTCSTQATGCAVSCGPGKGQPGKCSCLCPDHSLLNNEKTSCGCVDGFDPDPKTHNCVCNLPKINKGKYCELPNCPGKLQHHDSNGQCVCGEGLSVANIPMGCTCNFGVLSKDSICCSQLAADGSCAVADPNALGGGTICPKGQYYQTPPGQFKGKCADCPAGKVPNAKQSECVAAPPTSIRSVLSPAK